MEKRLYKHNKIFLIALAVILLFSLVLFTSSLVLYSNNSISSEVNSITRGTDVCVAVLRADGTYEPGIVESSGKECGHNVFYYNGMNITRDALGGQIQNATIRNISLNNVTGNATAAGVGAAPVADGSEAFTTRIGCGLNSVMGTYTTINQVPGNWTITNTFTSSCDNVLTNVTRLTNVTGGIFAGVSFAVVNLSTNDQLIINFTQWIS